MKNVFKAVIILSLSFGFVQTPPSEAKGEKYKVVKVENSNVMHQGRTVVRKALRITVEPGMSKTQLENTLREAAWSAYKQYKPNAVMIFGYRKGDNVSGTYSAGRCVLAPGGVKSQDVV